MICQVVNATSDPSGCSIRWQLPSGEKFDCHVTPDQLVVVRKALRHFSHVEGFVGLSADLSLARGEDGEVIVRAYMHAK